jgi:hypothetical protein
MAFIPRFITIDLLKLKILRADKGDCAVEGAQRPIFTYSSLVLCHSFFTKALYKCNHHVGIATTHKVLIATHGEMFHVT